MKKENIKEKKQNRNKYNNYKKELQRDQDQQQ